MDSSKGAPARPIAIGVVTFPISEPEAYFSPNLIRTLEPLASAIFLVTGRAGLNGTVGLKKVRPILIRHSKGSSSTTRLWNFLVTQALMAAAVARHARGTSVWLFHTGGDVMPLPVLVCRLMGKRALVVLTGSFTAILGATDDPYANVVELVSNMTLAFASRVGVYSSNAATSMRPGRKRRGAVVVHEQFVDPANLFVSTPFADRPRTVGYLGRLSEEKGVLNLLMAAPKFLKPDPDVRLDVAGSGPLMTALMRLSSQSEVAHQVSFRGFIPHSTVGYFLNGIRLLVLPSSTEGLPTAIIESMACGTPVLASSVGSIPDIVKDGQTGFLLDDNDPESIARHVTRALAFPDLNLVGERARALVASEYSFDAAVATYRRFLSIQDGC